MGKQDAALSVEQRQWVERALAEVRPDRLAELNASLVSIASPTGEEREIAAFLAERLRDAGLHGRVQPLDARQANAIGRLPGSGGGASLLLYAPIDTPFGGASGDDASWLGEGGWPPLRPNPRLDGDFVIGLGAENPKGYVTCIVAAAEAVASAGVPLRGDLLVGLAAGGAPVASRPSLERQNIGLGTGCAFLIEHGVRPDFAIIAKPGYAVSWEEVGSCWFRVRVRGALGYTGVRHLAPPRNPVIVAADVINELEAWFTEYTSRHTDGLVAPQGAVNGIEGGGASRVAFAPSVCSLYIDLRVSPRSSVTDVKRELEEALERIARKHHDFSLQVEMLFGFPGTTTSPDSWIVQSLIRAWEVVEGQPHTPIRGTSGFTDAGVLRSLGIPTARLGMPAVSPAAAYQGFSMGVCHVPSMARLTACLIHAIVGTCTRERGELTSWEDISGEQEPLATAG